MSRVVHVQLGRLLRYSASYAERCDSGFRPRIPREDEIILSRPSLVSRYRVSHRPIACVTAGGEPYAKCKQGALFTAPAPFLIDCGSALRFGKRGMTL